MRGVDWESILGQDILKMQFKNSGDRNDVTARPTGNCFEALTARLVICCVNELRFGDLDSDWFIVSRGGKYHH